MFQYAGHTHSATGEFFFRDRPEWMNFGLKADGFNSAADTCQRSGRLHDRQGMIFVR